MELLLSASGLLYDSSESAHCQYENYGVSDLMYVNERNGGLVEVGQVITCSALELHGRRFISFRHTIVQSV
jgi:hypothetical protein